MVLRKQPTGSRRTRSSSAVCGTRSMWRRQTDGSPRLRSSEEWLRGRGSHGRSLEPTAARVRRAVRCERRFGSFLITHSDGSPRPAEEFWPSSTRRRRAGTSCACGSIKAGSADRGTRGEGVDARGGTCLASFRRRIAGGDWRPIKALSAAQLRLGVYRGGSHQESLGRVVCNMEVEGTAPSRGVTARRTTPGRRLLLRTGAGLGKPPPSSQFCRHNH